MRAVFCLTRSPARATDNVDGSHEGIATRHAENVSCASATAARTAVSAAVSGDSVVDVVVDDSVDELTVVEDEPPAAIVDDDAVELDATGADVETAFVRARELHDAKPNVTSNAATADSTFTPVLPRAAALPRARSPRVGFSWKLGGCRRARNELTRRDNKLTSHPRLHAAMRSIDHIRCVMGRDCGDRLKPLEPDTRCQTDRTAARPTGQPPIPTSSLPDGEKLSRSGSP
jgi:hypothetical protein